MKFLKFILLPIILLCVAFLCWNIYQAKTLNTTNDSIEFIREHINSSGKLIDFNNQIGVKTVDNIKLFVTKKKIKIQFGKITLTWKPKEFISNENQELLKKIGITMYKDKETGKLRVYYYGEEVTRWVS